MTKFCTNTKKQGFSLVEAIAVICVISILACGSMLILSGSISRARQKASLSDVVNMHQNARRVSRETRTALNFDLHRQTVEFRANGSVMQTLELPTSMQIFKLAIGGAIIESNEQTVEYRHGGCETYAILVGSVKGRKVWHVFSGATGYVEVIDDEESTEASLVQWQARWANAH